MPRGTQVPSRPVGRRSGSRAPDRVPGRTGAAPRVQRPPDGSTPPAGSARLDRQDKAIIEQLQRDGRCSYAQIARQVGLSEPAVRQRVRRLLDAAVVQVVGVTDPLSLGFARQAMIGIRASGDLREVADKLARLDDVDYVVICAGSFDLLVELVVHDDEHLLGILNNSIRAIPGVRDTETFVYLRLVKQTYSWGTA